MRLIPTPELRFVLRFEPVGGGNAAGRRILQQKWGLDLDPNSFEEWRDVPLVEEFDNASG